MEAGRNFAVDHNAIGNSNARTQVANLIFYLDEDTPATSFIYSPLKNIFSFSVNLIYVFLQYYSECCYRI